MNRRILLVDDEIHILKSLTRVFIGTDYQIFTANSGADALSILRNQEVDLIVSDMRMPNMDGYELLYKVKIDYPDILGVILSAYADEKLIFRALQQNIAKHYIPKPWENDKLIKLIDQIFKTEAL
ncbi:MAG: response regulator [Bacillota bacterium]